MAKTKRLTFEERLVRVKDLLPFIDAVHRDMAAMQQRIAELEAKPKADAA